MYVELGSFLIIHSLTRFPDHRNGPSGQVLHHRRQRANPTKPSFSAPSPRHLQHPACPSPAPPNHFPSRRPRRDGSLDSYYAKNQSAVAAPRSLPSPTILGARPQKSAATVDVDSFGGTNVSSSSGSGSTSKGLKIQTTPTLTRSNTHTHTWVTSPAGKRTLLAMHPTGPINPRTAKLSTPVMSPTNTPVVMMPRSLPQLYISVSAPPTQPVSPEKEKLLPPLAAPPAVDAAIKCKAPEEPTPSNPHLTHTQSAPSQTPTPSSTPHSPSPTQPQPQNPLSKYSSTTNTALPFPGAPLLSGTPA